MAPISRAACTLHCFDPQTGECVDCGITYLRWEHEYKLYMLHMMPADMRDRLRNQWRMQMGFPSYCRGSVRRENEG